MKINQNTIIGLIMSIVFLVVLLSVASQMLPLGIESYYNMAQEIGSNSTQVGEGASEFIETTPQLLGWFWVLGPFILVILIITALFFRNKGRR